ncbi:MAG: hypothetical protein NW216_13665 [Hyphomicrobium sp.]|nr:hypothetical protein [Hyphomicrobium sp.]
MTTEDDIIGYTVAYDNEDITFPVYVVVTIAVALFAVATVYASPAVGLLALVPTAYAYYNLPLLEAGRPRIGSGEYGLFVEGLGLIGWRAIKSIENEVTEFRGTPSRELVVSLRQPIAESLLVDWRQRPYFRRPMRLPWSMKDQRVIRIPLDIMDKPPADIHGTLVRMWQFYRGG